MAEDKLAQMLVSLVSSDEKLDRVLTALSKAAAVTDDASAREKPKPHNVEELVAVYQKKQLGLKKSKRDPSQSSAEAGPSSASKGKGKKTKMFSLNFCKYRKAGMSFRRTTGNIQVSGFTDNDGYNDVVARGAKGLNVKADSKHLFLVVSGGLVVDAPLHGDKPWTLGEYVEGIGGSTARGKKAFGIYIPIGLDEEEQVSEKHSVKRKIEDSPVSVDEKRRKTITAPQLLLTSTLGSTKNDPIEVNSVNSSSAADYTHVNIVKESIVARYCPIRNGEVRTSIIATGRAGVWRIQNLEFDEGDGHVESLVTEELPPLQPEQHNEFILVEFSTAKRTYLKASPLDGSSVLTADLSFTVNDRLTHNSTTITKGEQESVPLVCISPNHGKASYVWERKSYGAWESLPVPSHTCLLYVASVGSYRCCVGCDSVIFTVIAKDKSISETESSLSVKYEEIEVGNVLGKGSFAIVNRGKWNGQDVALKRIRLPRGYECEETAAIKEIAILRQLKHPNIVSLLGYSKSDDEIILIMNYVEGHNLDCLLFDKRERKEFGASDVKQIATKIAKGVHYMHHHSPVVIHQDLKPQNVLISKDLSGVFVCDMGVTKLKKAGEATITSTSKGPGTYPYMAPEMFKKARRGPPVDIYSLGCLYLELFGRRRVWPGLDTTEIMMKICGSYNTPPCMPSMDHLEGTYLHLCAKCCQVDPSDRPTMDDILDMLAHV